MRGKQSRKKKHMKTTSQKKSNRLPQESEQSQQPAPQAQAEPRGVSHYGTEAAMCAAIDEDHSKFLAEQEAKQAQPKPDNRLPIDSEARKKNRTLPTEKVLQMLQTAAPDAFRLAEVVGRWVWVTFSEQPAAEIRQQLAQLGFHWNRERQAWQHPCGQFRLSSAGDPRERYTSTRPADMATH
jgi:hypothetical protein